MKKALVGALVVVLGFSAHTHLAIYNRMGQCAATLVDGFQ